MTPQKNSARNPSQDAYQKAVLQQAGGGRDRPERTSRTQKKSLRKNTDTQRRTDVTRNIPRKFLTSY
jgi:hypothetical protein